MIGISIFLVIVPNTIFILRPAGRPGTTPQTNLWNGLFGLLRMLFYKPFLRLGCCCCCCFYLRLFRDYFCRKCFLCNCFRLFCRYRFFTFFCGSFFRSYFCLICRYCFFVVVCYNSFFCSRFFCCRFFCRCRLY